VQDAGTEQAARAERIDLDQEIEDRLGFATADSKHSVRGDCLHRLAILIVHLELFLLVDAVDASAALDDALFEHQVASQLAQVGVLANSLGYDVAGAFEGVLDAGYFLLHANEGGSELVQRPGGGLLIPEVVGKRFETLIASDCRFRPALWAVRQVQIFQLCAVKCGFELRLQLIGQLALPLDRGEDGRAAAEEIAEVGELFLDGANLLWATGRSRC
jgi:hypothetical protein